MKLLNKAQILTAKDVKFVEVPTPEWAPDTVEETPGNPDSARPLTEEERAEYGVRIRNLTGAGRGAFIQKSIEIKQAEDNNEKADFSIEMMLVCMTAVDENNQPLFTLEDVAELGAKNAAAISRCATKAQELAGLNEVGKVAAEKK